MLLKPYFHGTTRRSGAPFCLRQHFPVHAHAKQRQRMHRFVQAQTFDIGKLEFAHAAPLSICFGSYRLWKATYFAFEVDSTCLIRALSGKPIHGTTIDHPSTQR